VVIKVLFVVLALCTAALVGVGLAIHFRVRRHLQQGKPEAHEFAELEARIQDDEVPKNPNT
jgi:hypothetical protein